MLRSALSAATRLVNGVAISANAVGTLVVLGLVGIVNYDAIARSFFNSPFQGAVEVVQFSMVLIVFLQLPDVVRAGRLTRSDGLLGMVSERHPRAGRLMARAIDLLSLTFMAIIAVAVWPEFLAMWASQDFFGIPGVFTAPWWPVKLAIFLSASLCAVIFVLHIIQGTQPSGDHRHGRQVAPEDGAGDDAL
ncbi:MAG: TRAP transporter small permease [Silicimonas sp.]|nr:TRAP transporter small permease [Silicimonas sp.]